MSVSEYLTLKYCELGFQVTQVRPNEMYEIPFLGQHKKLLLSLFFFVLISCEFNYYGDI